MTAPTSTAAAWHEWLAALAAADPRRRRFGATSHEYRAAPALGEAQVAALEAALAIAVPADARAFAVTVSGGGAGPFHGLLSLAHPAQATLARGTFPFTAPVAHHDGALGGVLALAHLGCEQLALLVVRGPAAGEVWLDARAADAGIGPIAPSFSAFVAAWIERTAAGRAPDAIVPAGRCGLPIALSSYLARCEAQRGQAPGSLSGAALHAALGALGPGSIAVTASGLDGVFAADEQLAPCVACETLIDQLRGRGLREDAVARPSAGLPTY